MFEITYKEIRDPSFVTGIRKIAGHDKYKDFKTTYNIGRVQKAIEQHQKEAVDVFRKLVTAHGKVKSSGAYDIDDDKKESFETAAKDFLDHKAKVERYKIRLEDIEGIPLTPSELTALEPVINDIGTLDS